MENPTEMFTFDMNALRTNLPQKRRGLSRCYSGKSRSFMCLADVHCLEDLKKQEHPDAKKRKKYTDRKEFNVVPAFPCRPMSATNQCATPFVGV